MPALTAAAAALCSSGIDPAHKTRLSVYHLNPRSAGALPVDMDTGDAAGDLNFYLGEFLLPLECADPTVARMGSFDCNNPERVDPDLVVTKVVLDADSRFTKYAACNLCNGTDPFSHKPCTVGSYVCDCFGHGGSSGSSCDPMKVGAESRSHSTHTPPPGPPTPPPPTVPCSCDGDFPYCWSEGCYRQNNATECHDNFCYKSESSDDKSASACPGRCTANYAPPPKCADALAQQCGKYAGHGSSCTRCVDEHRANVTACAAADVNAFCTLSPGHYDSCSPSSPDWACWRTNVERKTGGYWYSTLAAGQCNASQPDAPCGWDAVTLQTVREPCLKLKLVGAVEKASPACFTGCLTAAGARNMSSPCWVGCFMDGMLGAEARNSSSAPLGGMPIADLVAAWDSAFLPEAQGGCPTLSA